MTKWDSKILSELVDAIKHNKCYVFIGTGLSRVVGYRSWKGFKNKLAEIYYDSYTISEDAKRDMKDNLEKGNDDLGCLRLIYNASNREFYKRLTDMFKEKQNPNFTQTHIDLLKIGFHGVITTNYEFCIEDASKTLNNELQPHLGDIGVYLNSANKVVYHIHGAISNPTSCVVTSENYQQKYNKIFKSQLKDFLTNNVILYLGYSFKDIQLVEILHQKAFGDPKQRGMVNHFTLLPYYDGKVPITQSEIYYEDYGIRVQYYNAKVLNEKDDFNDNGEEHSELDVLIKELLPAVEKLGVSINEKEESLNRGGYEK